SPAPTGSVDPGKAVLHTFNVMVIDQDGTIRGYIDGKDLQTIAPLVGRVRSLVRTRYVLPALNAALNILCAVLLVAGYVSIRLRREGLHKWLMLAALAVSAAFLVSYLYYHFALVRQTPFQGEGWIRPVYFAV